MESRNSTKQKVHVGCQYSKACLEQPLKKDKPKILITNDSLMKVERIAECSLGLQMGKFWQISTELRPLIDVRN